MPSRNDIVFFVGHVLEGCQNVHDARDNLVVVTQGRWEEWNVVGEAWAGSAAKQK